MIGRWALLAGLLAGGALLLASPGTYAPWVDLAVCTAAGTTAAWLVLEGHRLWSGRRASGANTGADVGDGPHTD